MDYAALSVISTLCAIVFGYLAFVRNKRLDDSTEGKQSGTLLTEVGYIKAGVDDIKRKQEQQEERHIMVVSRLTAVESSATQAHKRIDTITKEK